MTVSVKAPSGVADIAATMAEIGRRARTAARTLALAPTAAKDAALAAMAEALRQDAARRDRRDL
jgi:glutamate-5-semialdehyde dehydrogenase